MIIISSSACSGGRSVPEGRTEKRPAKDDWISRIDLLYPGQLYITGLGMGRTKEDADNNAFRNISKSIKLHVRSREVSSEHYRQSDSRGDLSSFQYDDRLSVESEAILENARIEKHSFDEKKGMYHSLAVLRKSKYAEILSSRIIESKLRAEKILEDIDGESSPVIKLGLMFRLSSESASQKRDYDVLKVVSEDYQKYSPEPGMLETEEMIKKFLHRNFALSIDLKGELSEEIAMALKERFTENGYYIISPDEQDPDITVTGEIRIIESGRRDDRMVTANWSLNLNFKESESGNTIYSFMINDRQMQPDYEMAKARILYHIREEHAGNVIRGFQEKISGSASGK